MEKDFKRTLITTALPYANGPVHIGHLAGVYVPADIYARFLRMRGEDVLMIGGSDEHGVPITIKARNEGVTPQDIVDRYHTIIKDSMEGLGISFDIYSRTTSEIHKETASEFFRRLYDNSRDRFGVFEGITGQWYPYLEVLVVESEAETGGTTGLYLCEGEDGDTENRIAVCSIPAENREDCLQIWNNLKEKYSGDKIGQ